MRSSLPSSQEEVLLRELLVACQRGNLREVKGILERGLNPNQTQEKGESPLGLASEKGHLEIIQTLLDHGALVDFPTHNGRTALVMASDKGQLEAAEVLVERGASVNPPKVTELPLSAASRSGQTNVVRFLLDKGAEINASNKEGIDALMFSTSRGHADITEILIERGANIDAQNARKGTSLMYACINKRIDIVDILLRVGANARLKDAVGNCALSGACASGDLNMVDKLLMYGVDDKGYQDCSTHTPFMTACRYGHIHIIERLIDWRFDLNEKNQKGSNALQSACQTGKIDVIKFLISKGADPNCVSNDGWTCIMGTATGGHLEATEFLVSLGVNVNAVLDDGHSALMLAAQGGKAPIVEFLLSKGADPDLVNSDGKSALDLASEKGQAEVVAVLAKHLQSSSSTSSSSSSSISLRSSVSLGSNRGSRGLILPLVLSDFSKVVALSKRKVSTFTAEEVSEVAKNVGFSVSIQNSIKRHEIDGKKMGDVDHRVLQEQLHLNEFSDRKRLLFLFATLLSNKLGHLVDALIAIEISLRENPKGRPIFGDDQSDSKKIEDILGFQEEKFGEIIKWTSERLMQWIRETEEIKELEHLIAPLNLTGFVLSVSSDQELKDVLVPILQGEEKTRDLINAFNLKKGILLSEKEFVPKECLKGYFTIQTCEQHLRDLNEKINIEAFEDFMAVLRKNVATINSTWNNPHKLTTDEMYAIVAYTQDNDNAVNNGQGVYDKLNDCLRRQDPAVSRENLEQARSELKHWKGYLHYFLQGLQKLPEIEGHVYRGISRNTEEAAKALIEDHSKEGVIEWFAFSSTSKDPNVALAFIRDQDHPGLFAQINLKAGWNIEDYSAFPDEKEVLILPNTIFVVEKPARQLDGPFQPPGFPQINLGKNYFTLLLDAGRTRNLFFDPKEPEEPSLSSSPSSAAVSSLSI